MSKKLKLTTEQFEKLKRLIIQFKNDPIKFIETLLIPTDLDAPIKLYEKQKQLVKLFLEKHFVIVNSSRQVGKTTAVAALMTWLLIFFPKYRIAVISKDGDHVKDIIIDVYNMLLNVLDIFGLKLEVDNEFEKRLSNGSRIKGYKIPKDNPAKVGRGIRAGFIYIDEAAFIKYIDVVYAAMGPATSRIQQIYKEKGYPYGIIITSTPNGTEGVGKWFYTMWMDAVNGNSIYVPLTIHWSDTPFYDEKWAEEERKKYDKLTWEQEFELKFISSGTSFLDTDMALELQETLNFSKNTTTRHSVYSKKYGDLLFTFYDKMKRDKVYLIGVDSASGEGGTSEQAVVILEYPDLRVVATATAKLPILNFADSLAQFIYQEFKNGDMLYDNFVFFIERNFLGEAIIDYFRREHPNLYARIFSIKEVRGSDPSKAFRLSKSGVKIIKGIQTNTKTRPLMFDALYSYLLEHQGQLNYYIPCPKLASQLLSLEYVGKNRVESSTGNDDLVMALAIVLYAYKYLPKDFRRYISLVEMETTKEDQVIDILSLYRSRY